MNRPLTALVAVLATFALAGCGGDDDVAIPAATDPAPVETEPAGTDTETTNTGTDRDVEVDPTIAPDLPEEFLAGVGPLGVIGDALPALPDDGADPAVGTPVPILVGEDFDGDRVRLDPAVDGPTWVVFLAHWCPHCNDEIPVINGLRDDGLIPDGIEVVAVSTAANPERPNYPPGQWLDDMDWTFQAIADGVDTELSTYIGAEAYGVTGFPFSVLVDADGRVAARWSGGRSADELVSLLTDNLATA